MPRSSALIALACLLSLSLLAVTFWVGSGSAPQAPQLREITPPDPSSLKGFRTVDAQQPAQTPKVELQKYRFESRNERGQLTEIFSERIHPLDATTSQIDSPVTRIHLAPDRVLELRGREGRIDTSQQRPQQGQFLGPAAVVLFQAEQSKTVDLGSDRDVALRVDLEEGAIFDMQLGKIESLGPVSVDSGVARMKGRGLDLRYNEVKKRIERLSIARGEVLELWSDASSRRADGKSPASAADSSPRDVGGQWYQVQMASSVRILQAESWAQADVLTAWFLAEKPEEAGAKPAGGSTEQTGQRSAPLLPIKRSKPADVLVHWEGPLVMTPVDEKPAMMPPGQKQHLQLAGKPLELRTRKQEVLRAASMDHTPGIALTKLHSSPQHPVQLQSPEIGDLAAESITLDDRASVIKAQGPGLLRARVGSGNRSLQPAPPLAMARKGEGPVLTVEWLGELDLKLTGPAGPEALQTSPVPGELRALRRELQSAVFSKDVRVVHPQLQMRSEELALSLRKRGSQTLLERMTAKGNVEAHARGDRDKGDARELEALDLRADQLTVDMDEAAPGKAYAKRLLAHGDVQAQQPGRQLSSQELEVDLRPPGSVAESQALASPAVLEATDPLAEPTQSLPGVKPARKPSPIRRLIASRQVRVAIEKQDLQLVGDRLVADLDSDQYDVIGREKPAAIQMAEGKLEGGHLILQQDGGKVRVAGPGRFAFTSKPRPDPRLPASGAPQQPAQPRSYDVTWVDSMQFRQDTGSARFEGGVQALSAQGLQTSRLSCDTLDMSFAADSSQRPPLLQTQRAQGREAHSGNGQGAEPGALRGNMALQKLTASGAKVVFLLENWLDRAGGTLGTRVRTEGKTLEYDQLHQQIQVPGAGLMLVQDDRPRAAKPAQNPEQPAPAVASFSGRGKTLFTWQGGMLIDAAQNDLLMHDQVQMVHQPEQADTVQLDCHRLMADLQEVSGVKPDTRTTAQPKLTAVLAEAGGGKRLRLITGKRTLVADHLEYLASDQTVTFWADPQARAMADDGVNPPLYAEQFIWNLRKQQLRIAEPGAARSRGQGLQR